MFVNRLKYGQHKQPEYTQKALTNALMVGDEEKAEIILREMLKRKLNGG